jgi:carbon monoxide dehydrogenase subunit G
MIETDHRFEIDAPIGEVWAYASDIGNWASGMPGYESFEAVDELRSNWVLKVALGALTKRIQLNVTITHRHEPDQITFELQGASDPVEGRGTFTAAVETPALTSVVVSLAIWGNGPMAATMEAMSRPVVPRMTRVVSDAFKAAVELTGTAAADRASVPGSRPVSPQPGVGSGRRRQTWGRWRESVRGDRRRSAGGLVGWARSLADALRARRADRGRS